MTSFTDLFGQGQQGQQGQNQGQGGGNTQTSGVQIINNGASIKIVTDGVARLIYKSQIREISVIRDSIIRIDIGEGALYNVFIDQTTVTSPQTSSAEALRDAINEMLASSLSISGFATEAKQSEQIGQVNNIQAFLQPLMQDESNANTIYNGYAAPNSLTSAAVWAIQKVTNNKGVISYKWADGNKLFDNIWDNRTSLTYK